MKSYLEREPNHVGATVTLAWLLGLDGEAQDLEESGRLIEAAVKIARGNEVNPAQRVLAATRFRQKKYQQALPTLIKLADMGDRGSPFDLYYLAMTQFHLGDRTSAAESFARGEYLAGLSQRSPFPVTSRQLERVRTMAADLVIRKK